MAVGIAKMLYDNTGVYEKTISKRRHRFDRLTGIKEATTGYMAQKPANIGLRSQYALRLYGWAKKHLAAGTRRITLEDFENSLAWSR